MTELLNINLYLFLMVFLRMGSAIMLMPGFTASYVSTQIRLSIALTLTVILMPIVAELIPPTPERFDTLLQYILKEITVGIFLAIVVQIMFSSLSLAGNIAGQAIGFSNAQNFNPATQNQSIIIESFFGVTALTIIFMANLHHLMLSALVDSYHLFPVGAPLPWGDLANQMSQSVNGAFVAGFKLGSPFIAFTIVFYTGMGLVSRLMPQLNIFFLSLPLQIYLGAGLLFITMPMIILWFIRYFDDGIQLYLH